MGLNEVGPVFQSNYQMLTAFVLLLLSHFINSFFLGEFVNIAFKILERGMDR